MNRNNWGQTLSFLKTRRTSCLLILETVPTPYFMVFPILYTYIQYTKALSICANFASTQASSYLDSDLVGSWHISLEYTSRNLYPVSIFCFILSCVSSYFYQFLHSYEKFFKTILLLIKEKGIPSKMYAFMKVLFIQ